MTELEVVAEAATLLQVEGRASIEYIIAEFSPFSGQQRPDLTFVPNLMPGKVFFVEFRMTEPILVDSDIFVHRLLEHRDFVASSSPGFSVEYSFSSGQPLQESVVGQMRARGIRFIGPVRSGQELAQEILKWVSRNNALR